MDHRVCVTDGSRTAPFGTDLTPVEQRLARALKRLKRWSGSKPRLALQAARGLLAGAGDEEALALLGLAPPRTLRATASTGRPLQAETEEHRNMPESQT